MAPREFTVKRNQAELNHQLLPGVDWSEFVPPLIGDWHPQQRRLPDEAFSSRGCVLKAYENLMENICGKHLQGHLMVVEIGPGTGFPYDVLPERVKRNWVQVEWNPSYIKELESRHPDADVRRGTALSLPFLPDTLDAVFGCGSYDTVHDIRKAIKSASNKIRKEGLFIHMMDTNPDPTGIREWMKQEGKHFPKVISSMPFRNVELKETNMYFDSEDILNQFEKARQEDMQDFGDSLKYGEKSQRILDEHGKKADFRKEYNRILCQVLVENGFELEFNGTEQGRWEGKRQKRHYIKDSEYWNLPDDPANPKYNFLDKFAGVKYTRGWAEPVELIRGNAIPETIYELVEVSLIVAKKK